MEVAATTKTVHPRRKAPRPARPNVAPIPGSSGGPSQADREAPLVTVERDRHLCAVRGPVPPLGRPVAAPRTGQRRVPGRVDALHPGQYGVDGAQPEQQQQHQRG